jgi:hypothetical protein
MPRRCGIFWVLLLIIASSCGIAWAQTLEGHFSSSERSLPDASSAAPDFDGDRVVDVLTLDRTGGDLRLEIHFGRTHRVSFLPVDSSLAVTGSLTVRDLDNDGDSDLFWQGRRALAPSGVIVWLNDGAGRFARLLSLSPQQIVPWPRRSFRKNGFRMATHYEVLPSKRVSSSLLLLVAEWTWQSSGSGKHAPWTITPFITLFIQLPSDRGPPFLC